MIQPPATCNGWDTAMTFAGHEQKPPALLRASHLATLTLRTVTSPHSEASRSPTPSTSSISTDSEACEASGASSSSSPSIFD